MKSKSMKHIKGNTYYIGGGTNSGIYKFEDGSVLLIDPGVYGKRQEKIIKILEEENLKLRYIINTHEHEDHVGGIYQLRERFPDVEILSSEKSRIYIENPEEYMDYLMAGKRTEELIKDLGDYIKGLVDPSCRIRIDKVINSDSTIELNGKKFDIISSSGHTEGCISIVTEDGVAFLGDLLITKNSLDKFNFLFMGDYEKQIKSLDRLRMVDFDYAVLGHSRNIYEKSDILKIAGYNHKKLIEMIGLTLEILKTPKNYDELTSEFIEKRHLPNGYVYYFEYKSSISAVVAYLLDRNIIEYIFDGCMMKYRIKDDKE